MKVVGLIVNLFLDIERKYCPRHIAQFEYLSLSGLNRKKEDQLRSSSFCKSLRLERINNSDHTSGKNASATSKNSAADVIIVPDFAFFAFNDTLFFCRNFGFQVIRYLSLRDFCFSESLFLSVKFRICCRWTVVLLVSSSMTILLRYFRIFLLLSSIKTT